MFKASGGVRNFSQGGPRYKHNKILIYKKMSKK